MRKYECLFILRSDLEESKRVGLVDKFKNIVAADGEMTTVEEWGTRKLAYEIEKQRDGYYVLFNFKANTTLPAELERNFKITDDVIRFVVINREEK